MISVPGWPNISTAKNMVGLPPGMITTLSGFTVHFRYFRISAATAARTSGMPLAGV
jgi:hypothetical protein